MLSLNLADLPVCLPVYLAQVDSAANAWLLSHFRESRVFGVAILKAISEKNGFADTMNGFFFSFGPDEF